MAGESRDTKRRGEKGEDRREREKRLEKRTGKRRWSKGREKGKEEWRGKEKDWREKWGGRGEVKCREERIDRNTREHRKEKEKQMEEGRRS